MLTLKQHFPGSQKSVDFPYTPFSCFSQQNVHIQPVFHGAGHSLSASFQTFVCVRFHYFPGKALIMTPFRSSMICSFVAFRLCAITFFSYKISYCAESICLPDKIYSKIFLALFPFMSVMVPDILMLAPSSIKYKAYCKKI